MAQFNATKRKREEDEDDVLNTGFRLSPGPQKRKVRVARRLVRNVPEVQFRQHLRSCIENARQYPNTLDSVNELKRIFQELDLVKNNPRYIVPPGEIANHQQVVESKFNEIMYLLDQVGYVGPDGELTIDLTD